MDDNVERISISLHMCVCVVGYAHELLDKRLIFASSVHCILKWTLLLYNASGKVQAEKTLQQFSWKIYHFHLVFSPIFLSPAASGVLVQGDSAGFSKTTFIPISLSSLSSKERASPAHSAIRNP